MPRLPVLSGREVIRGLGRLGFEVVGQRGSHVKLRRNTVTVIVPDHREIRKGTLVAIMQQAGVTIEELTKALAN